jgi:hypothetical protein
MVDYHTIYIVKSLPFYLKWWQKGPLYDDIVDPDKHRYKEVRQLEIQSI